MAEDPFTVKVKVDLTSRSEAFQRLAEGPGDDSRPCTRLAVENPTSIHAYHLGSDVQVVIHVHEAQYDGQNGLLIEPFKFQLPSWGFRGRINYIDWPVIKFTHKLARPAAGALGCRSSGNCVHQEAWSRDQIINHVREILDALADGGR